LLIVSCWNYRGEPMSCSRDELSGWRTGFYLELYPQRAFRRDDDFDAHVAGIVIHDRVEAAARRRVTVAGAGETMEMIYDPYRELVLSRTFNGVEEGVNHLDIDAAGPSPAPFCPGTFYGSELLP
jgi:hypothetical protein